MKLEVIMKTEAGKKKMNRRDFVLSGAAGVATFTIVPRR
jgi:hypothetical protein